MKPFIPLVLTICMLIAPKLTFSQSCSQKYPFIDQHFAQRNNPFGEYEVGEVYLPPCESQLQAVEDLVVDSEQVFSIGGFGLDFELVDVTPNSEGSLYFYKERNDSNKLLHILITPNGKIEYFKVIADTVIKEFQVPTPEEPDAVALRDIDILTINEFGGNRLLETDERCLYSYDLQGQIVNEPGFPLRSMQSGSNSRIWYLDGTYANFAPREQVEGIFTDNRAVAYDNNCDKQLFISEYIENGVNDCIELYNPTDQDIDISNYIINDCPNGTNECGDGQTISTDSMNNPVIIPANGSFVICSNNDSLDEAFKNKADVYAANLSFDGDDAIVLYDEMGNFIDIIGVKGCDPGEFWGTNRIKTKAARLIRRPQISSPKAVEETVKDSCAFATIYQWEYTNLDGMSSEDIADELGQHTINSSEDQLTRQNAMYYANSIIHWYEQLEQSGEHMFEVNPSKRGEKTYIEMNYNSSSDKVIVDYHRGQANLIKIGYVNDINTGISYSYAHDHDQIMSAVNKFVLSDYLDGKFSRIYGDFNLELLSEGINNLLIRMYWEDNGLEVHEEDPHLVLKPYSGKSIGSGLKLEERAIDLRRDEALGFDMGVNDNWNSDRNQEEVWSAVLYRMYELFKRTQGSKQAGRIKIWNLLMNNILQVGGNDIADYIGRLQAAALNDEIDLIDKERTDILCWIEQYYRDYHEWYVQEEDSTGFLLPLAGDFCAQDTFIWYQPLFYLNALNTDCDTNQAWHEVSIHVVYGADTTTYQARRWTSIPLPISNEKITIIPFSNATQETVFEPAIVTLDSARQRQTVRDGGQWKDTICMFVEEALVLEHVVWSIDDPRPGFEITYDLQIQNQGLLDFSGQVKLGYASHLMNLLSSTVTPMNIVEDTLIWELDILAGSSQVIKLNFLMNTPLDANPLNQGDILEFRCMVEGQEDYILSQEVVNSYDPNDKTCMQGKRMEPEQLDDALVYRIRFENTGTADAVNVRIADTLDADVYHIHTVRYLESSHECVLKQEGNVLEFIFDDINLPFQDSINDGYVFYTVEPKSNHLEIGDSLINGAAIYFDFNPPIITNDEVTVVYEKMVNSESTQVETDIHIFPNPVLNELFFQNAVGAAVDIFDLQGKCVYSIKELTTPRLEVGHLPSGMYSIRLYKGGQSSVLRFVKL